MTRTSLSILNKTPSQTIQIAIYPHRHRFRNAFLRSYVFNFTSYTTVTPFFSGPRNILTRTTIPHQVILLIQSFFDVIGWRTVETCISLCHTLMGLLHDDLSFGWLDQLKTKRMRGTKEKIGPTGTIQMSSSSSEDTPPSPLD